MEVTVEATVRFALDHSARVHHRHGELPPIKRHVPVTRKRGATLAEYTTTRRSGPSVVQLGDRMRAVDLATSPQAPPSQAGDAFTDLKPQP
ncbi:uncharacterized protein HKW66_Vig0169090 [Vigna angularis]|uniref:Uncharacterized protein n=1 Tax=Phaseolus angularis TaxID=3914 RepID=A0A8T0JQF6_PHAAN|nr:uncharacterized protein HKW66_Vig0169090 [Vigna angularis]